MKDKFDFKPTIVLALVAGIVTALLVIAERSVQYDETQLSGKLADSCIELMGEGEYKVLLDWLEEGYPIEKPPEVAKLIKNTTTGGIAFQIIVNGYSTNGINMLIVMDEDGGVEALTVVENKETAKIGTRVEDPAFMNNFLGRADPVRIVKGTPRADNEIAALTGATRSSNAVANAVNLAIETYEVLYG